MLTAADGLLDCVGGALKKLSNYGDFRKNIFGTNSSRGFIFSLEGDMPKNITLEFVNPRLESPILNLKLRRFVLEYQAVVKVIGFVSNLNYDYTHSALLLS